MARRQRTNNGLHKSSPKSALSVLEKLFSPYNDELSVKSILDLAYYPKQLKKYLSSNIIQSKNINEPIIRLNYMSRPIV
jgi:hypothetical protein